MEFQTKIQQMALGGEFKECLEELINPNNLSLLKICDLDLIHFLGREFLCDNECPLDLVSDGVNFCEKVFYIVAKLGKPKELILAFLEIIENVRSDIRLGVLLPPIQISLLRIPVGGKRLENLNWVLQHIGYLIEKIPAPSNYGLEGKEKQLLESNSHIDWIGKTMEYLLEFYQPFIDEVSLFRPKILAEDQFGSTRNLLSDYLIQLLDVPFAYVDLSQEESCLRDGAKQLVNFLCKLKHNVFDYLSQSRASATFFYLVLATGLNRQQLYCVYSNVYVFNTSLSLSKHLLQDSHEFTIEKGLSLLDSVLNLIPELYLAENVLEIEDYAEVTSSLINIMITNSVLSFRQKSMQILLRVINVFDCRSRYKLYLRLIRETEHSGVRDLLISQFKKTLIFVLNKGEIGDMGVYTGKSLGRALKVMCQLARGAETDLIDERERILAALNILLYLFKKDKADVNETGVWNLVSNLEVEFLKPLQSALDLSKAHFAAELEFQKQRGKSNETGNDVSVQGLPLPPVPTEQKIETIQTMLIALDLIQSVLAYVVQTINNK